MGTPGEQLIEMMHSPSRPDSGYTDEEFATVLAAEPISLQLASNFIIDSAKGFNIELSMLVQDYEVQFTVPDPEGSYKATFKLWRKLKAGDQVRVLRCGKGQTYLILERVNWQKEQPYAQD